MDGAIQGISRYADDLLSRVQVKDSGELGESLTKIMLKVKDVNVSGVIGSPGFLQSLPLVGSLFSSAKRTVAKFNTPSEQIEIIVNKLDEAMIGLLRDIETLEMRIVPARQRFACHIYPRPCLAGILLRRPE